MKPKVALLGCGRWGRNIARCLNEAGALVSVSDADEGAARAFAETFDVPARPVGEALGSDDCNAVAIATPAVTHADVALAALTAGKHVFVEKPMAMHVSDAERVADTAERMGRTVMVGHLLQYHPAFLALLEHVQAGLVGRLRYVYSNRLSFGQIRTEENSLWSFAPHDISMILALMAEEPARVDAVGAAFLQPGLPDVTTTHMTFSEGRRAHVFVSWLHPFKEQRLVVVGADGMLEFNDSQPWSSKLKLYRHQVDWHGDMPTMQKAEAEALQVKEGEPLKAEIQHFLDCVAGKISKPRTDAVEAIRVLRVLNAAQASLDSALPR